MILVGWAVEQELLKAFFQYHKSTAKKHCQKPLSTKIYLGNQKKVYNIKVDSGDWMIEENDQSDKLY